MTGLIWWTKRVGCSLALVVTACGDDSGLLIEVSRDATVPSTLDRLSIYAGTDVVAGDGLGFADQAPSSSVELGGRDLLTDPYRLFLSPTDTSADQHVMVAVLAYEGAQLVGFGSLAAPVHFVDGMVGKWPVVLTQTLPPGLAVDDSGCLSWLDPEGERVVIGRPPDLDCDGYGADDCNDLDPTANPGSLDICDTAVDEDCDGAVDEDVDDDGDSFTTCGGDCDDRSEAINPEAAERCDGVDNDCNAACDEGFDADGDHFTPCGSKLKDDGSCSSGDEFVDCDDDSDLVYPFAAELCDGVDNDCNLVCDDGEDLDPDSDAYTDCGSIVGICELDESSIDCEPEDPAIHPAAVELCNGVDDDCDGALLETAPCFAEAEGLCYVGGRACDEAGVGGFAGDCAVEAIAANEVEQALCDAYVECDLGGDPDPHACAIEAASGPSLACVVAYQPAAGDQCPENTFPMPTGGSLTCTWAVVGGLDQGGYLVGFTPEGGGELAATGVCDAILTVALDNDGGVPAPRSVALQRSDLGVTTVVQLDLTAQPTAECLPPLGLACTGP